nr:hypothetical protein [Corynebacterium endometrii]
MEHAEENWSGCEGRAVRLAKDRILAENLSMQAAGQAVAPKLGASWHTARQWVQQARRDGLSLVLKKT